MYYLLSRLYPRQEEDDFLDDMFSQDPNDDLLISVSPLAGVLISILLAAMLLVGIVLAGWGTLGFFAASGNAPKQASARAKLVGGLGAIFVSVIGWAVFGDVLRSAMDSV